MYLKKIRHQLYPIFLTFSMSCVSLGTFSVN